MKRTICFLLNILLSTARSAQPQTTITVKIFNSNDSIASLQIPTFSLTTMKEGNEVIKATINPADGTFSLVTNKVVDTDSYCLIRIGPKVLGILLSPGDSIHIETYPAAIDKMAKFSGNAAGKNDYLGQHNQLFYDSKRFQKTFHKTASVDDIRDYLFDEKELIMKFYQSGQVDSLFYSRELARIQQQFISQLKETWSDDLKKFKDLFDSWDIHLNQINLNDYDLLKSSGTYRMFIFACLDLFVRPDIAAQKSKAGFSLPQQLDIADSILRGPSQTYYVYSVIQNINQGYNQDQRRATIQYTLSRYDNPELVTLLKGLLPVSNSKISPVFFPGIYLFTYGSLRMLAFFVAALVIAFSLNPTNEIFKKQNPLSALLRFLVFITAIYGWWMIGMSFQADDHLKSSVTKGFVMAVFFGLHTFGLIPHLINRKKLILYALSLLILLSVYVALQYMISTNSDTVDPEQQRTFFEHVRLPLVIYMLLIPGSFLGHYLLKLISHSRLCHNQLSKKGFNPEVIFHILIISYFLATTIYFNHQTGSVTEALIRLLPGLLIFYGFAFVIIPRYFFRTRYYRGILTSLILVLSIVITVILIETQISCSELKKYSIEPDFWSLIRLPKHLLVYLLIIPAIIYALVRKKIIERNSRNIHLRNKEAELQQLRSQVNPHFLFNSLNTVYAFALKENNPKTAEYIAKLASLMRYLIEDMEKERIPVEKEIEYIRDYINMQKIRSSVEHVIDIKVDIQKANFQIAPMLMIPFVENAFKHGMNPNKISELMIFIQVTGQQFKFEVENSVDRNFKAFYKEKGFGIGIENVQQRLQYIYPGQHTLNINKSDDRFTVKMTIESK
ncbi:MAG: histidine kinase [Bacteroidota bacterium]